MRAAYFRVEPHVYKTMAKAVAVPARETVYAMNVPGGAMGVPTRPDAAELGEGISETWAELFAEDRDLRVRLIAGTLTPEELAEFVDPIDEGVVVEQRGMHAWVCRAEDLGLGFADAFAMYVGVNRDASAAVICAKMHADDPATAYDPARYVCRLYRLALISNKSPRQLTETGYYLVLGGCPLAA
jgi:hypothetical protein